MMMLMSVVEPMEPNPRKNLLLQLAQMEDKHLRIFGAIMMVSGALTFNYIQS